jgi:hypothetical protein
MATVARPQPVRRVFLWIVMVTAALVVLGVFLQAFSIAAYARGAGSGALDMHETVGFITHSVEIVVFLAAIGAFWRDWWRIGLALLLPVIGTIQVFLIGDTEEPGGWVNGLHGLLALVVLLLAAVLGWEGVRPLWRR